MRPLSELHFLVPDSIADTDRPTGGNTYDRELAEALRASGCEVRLHGIPDCLPRPSPAATRAISQRIETLPAGSQVLVDGLLAFAAPHACTAATRRLRLSVLVHTLPDDGADLRAAYELLRAAHAVITTSEWTRRAILAERHAPSTAVQVAPAGVAQAPLTAGSLSGERLLCIANVAAHKGQDVLVDALVRLRHRHWTCEVVGALDWQPEYVRDLQARIGAAQLADRIRFDDVVTGDRLNAVLADSDLLVVPSRSESYGLVIGEALARGLPVIASQVGGIPEALGRTDDGRLPGLLVPPGNPFELARAIDVWLENAALRDELRAAALIRREALARWADTAQAVTRALSAGVE